MHINKHREIQKERNKAYEKEEYGGNKGKRRMERISAAHWKSGG